jgi:hypothetical protein
MPRPLSLMFIVPAIALPFWISVQVNIPWPLVSDEGPVQVPDTLVSVPPGFGVGAAGAEVLPPHALTVMRLKATSIKVRMARFLPD